MPWQVLGGEMTLAKRAKNAERSGFAGRGVSGGGDIPVPLSKDMVGDRNVPPPLLICAHPCNPWLPSSVEL